MGAPSVLLCARINPPPMPPQGTSNISSTGLLKPASHVGKASTTCGTRLRGRRGSLATLPNMPLDIIQEIFGYLKPRDLLHLARSNKALRSFLMNRSSAFIWKKARNSFEPPFPDCPPDLSEPSYANLAFSHHCHRCLKFTNTRVLWQFRARYCPSCTTLMTISADVYSLPPSLKHLLICERDRTRGETCRVLVVRLTS